MPEIHAVTQFPGRSPDEVWSIVKNSLAFAARAEHVVGVSLLPSSDKRYRSTEWTVLLNGSEVTWVQEETARPGLRLAFEQTAGDLEQLTGEWSVSASPGGSQVGLAISFELGIDGLAPLLNPIWAQSFQAHADALLRAAATHSHENGNDDT
ncbi:SRPBCC family protein [Streptomyces sp. NPDC001584]|uniref:type II toxin-antitoxin system RatA family toxin n=1 Tax=Streptomyces sp. NPDC001584 TaxID=3154521 RepID=UPI0033255DEC